MIKTLLAIVGAGFLVYEAAMAWDRHVHAKYSREFYDKSKGGQKADEATA